MTIIDWLSLLISAVPAALVGFLFGWVEKRLAKLDEKRTKAQKEREKRNQEAERIRQQQMLFLVQMQEAIATLSTATAKAVQRIPDAHCNGDMSRALEYARRVKRDQRDFLQQQGIKHIYEDD